MTAGIPTSLLITHQRALGKHHYIQEEIIQSGWVVMGDYDGCWVSFLNPIYRAEIEIFYQSISLSKSVVRFQDNRTAYTQSLNFLALNAVPLSFLITT